METRDPVPSAFETTISDRDMNYQFLTVPAAIRAATTTRVDKENVMQHCQHDASPKSSPAKPSAASPSPLTVRTPSPSGASALQPRLSLLSMTTDSPAGKQRFMDQMSLRVLTPTRMLDPMSGLGLPPACNPIPLTEPKPHRHRGVQSRRRRSRDAPYSQQFLPVDRPASPTTITTAGSGHWSTGIATGTNVSGEQSSTDSVAAEMDTTPTRSALSPLERSDCINPVAFTLWRGGQEDREWLQEQDRSWNDTTHTVRVESPLPPRMAAPRQVSNNLQDVYGANYYWEISRPIPRRRHEDVCYINRMK